VFDASFKPEPADGLTRLLQRPETREAVPSVLLRSAVEIAMRLSGWDAVRLRERGEELGQRYAQTSHDAIQHVVHRPHGLPAEVCAA
jgi:hypothetical protein